MNKLLEINNKLSNEQHILSLRRRTITLPRTCLPQCRSSAPPSIRGVRGRSRLEDIEHPFQGQIVRRDVFRHGCVDAPVGDEGDLSLIERLDANPTVPASRSVIPLPPLDCLRFFEAAARHRSFVRAAEELGVTPPAVAHRIRMLEVRDRRGGRGAADRP